jgi:hypothetical protein
MATIKEEPLSEGQMNDLVNSARQSATESNLLERYLNDASSLIGYGWEAINYNARALVDMNSWQDKVIRARNGAIHSPLIAAGIRAYELLVWSGGVFIKAEDDDLDAVIQSFLKLNKKSFTSQQEQQDSEKNLRTDGNIFLKLHTDIDTGNVIIRDVDCLQITDIICNPNDEVDVWIYERQYNKIGIGGVAVPITIGYPDIAFFADDKTRSQIENELSYEIEWDIPILHTSVNRTRSFKFGLPEFSASIPWARAYERFLEHRATLYAAYAAFALLVKVRADKIAATKAKLTRVLPNAQTGQGNISPVKGATGIIDDGGDISALQTGNATTPPSEGLQFAEMVFMDFGLPAEVFGKQQTGGLGDGSSRYMLLNKNVQSRQSLWTSIYQQLFDYVKLQAVKYGDLTGTIDIANTGDGLQEVVIWPDSFNPTVEMAFSPLDKEDSLALLDAMVNAVTLKGQQPNGVVTPKQYMMQVSKAFDIDIDLDGVADEWPTVMAAVESQSMKVLNEIETALNESIKEDAQMDNIPS